MKISTFVQLFLVIAAFMVIFGLMSDEAKVYYPESNINDSEWYGKYNYAEQINESTSGIQTSLKNIGDDETGWFTKILSGIAAIPKAAIGLVSLVFTSFFLGGKIITGSLTTLNIPGAIIGIILVVMIIWGIFKLIEIYHKPSIPI